MFADKTRIKLEMTGVEMIHAMSEGNIGAVNVLMKMMELGPTIDPDAVFGPFSHILLLDTFGIYGPDIWCLYKDVGSQRMDQTLAVVRAVQMGILDLNSVKAAIQERGKITSEVLDEAMLKLLDKLPDFKLESLNSETSKIH